MTLANVRDWLEVIGLFSVVLSLIFVGFEIKQSRDIAIATEFQARADHNLAISSLLYGDDQRMKLYGAAFRGAIEAAAEAGDLGPFAYDMVKSSNDEELGRRLTECDIYVFQYENLYLQWELGMLREDRWATYEKYLAELVAGPCLFNFDRAHLPESFRSLINEMKSHSGAG